MGIVKNWLKSGLSSVKPLLSFAFMIGIPYFEDSSGRLCPAVRPVTFYMVASLI